jgi:hypothetical protein
MKISVAFGIEMGNAETFFDTCTRTRVIEGLKFEMPKPAEAFFDICTRTRGMGARARLACRASVVAAQASKAQHSL